MALSVPRSRLLDLLKQQAQCRIFSHTYNPERQRLGNKVLRQRLRGPALASYYPQRIGTLKELGKAYEHLGLRMVDYEEGERLEVIERLKSRGKGNPKKRRTAAESRSAKKRG
ncbi:mitochondrial 37S ribosomal protein RSM27 [Paracoccidioides brasiliensis Pb18]|uniref:Small ribosomal subunit protein mS33 n=1 Tax=Paracoccidioides brasiliensis (strain Pb18) TaxID=502780 RepID=C1GGU0_PARBD|nr:mitochondrial 37S ribosomal protein RSM27 [Paracoccidioides brasiliensis Pb18]EEH50448.2 hypothetical protein PADG_06527 [Paracoccidioides brasiliensis Pb18]